MDNTSFGSKGQALEAWPIKFIKTLYLNNVRLYYSPLVFNQPNPHANVLESTGILKVEILPSSIIIIIFSSTNDLPALDQRIKKPPNYERNPEQYQAVPRSVTRDDEMERA